MNILYIIGIIVFIIIFLACFIYAFCIHKWISKKRSLEISFGLIVIMVCSIFICMIFALKLLNT